jgi:peptidoglycan hydrolase-like protein with peptidoglycan-binding domain
MRIFALPLMLLASFGLTTPILAQDLGDIIGEIAQSLIQQEVDSNAYTAAQDANTVAAYRDYLAKFSKGKYRTNAESALARLGTPVDGSGASAAQTETRLGITVSQRVTVQRELTRLGYQTYGADGVWGRNTRTAISTWQRDRGDKVTGYVTAEQLRLLSRGAVVTPPMVDPPLGTLTAAQTEAALRLTRTQRTTIQRQLTAIGYDAGVADGLWGSRTRAAISAWQRVNRGAQTGYVTAAQVKLIASQAGTATPAPDDNASGLALEESLLELTRAERVDLQGRLRQLGYKSLRTDGTFGAGTRRAIAEWQADEGETATGYLTADQVRLIRVETGG